MDLNVNIQIEATLIILRNYKYETILCFLEKFHDIRTSMRTLDRVWFYVYAGGSGSRGYDFDEDQLINMLLFCIRRELGGPG